MEAYYYSFDSTGCDPIDKILSAVACAGKSFHHTDDWYEHASPQDDHTGGTPIDWIQNAAIEAAAEIQSLRDQIYESIPMWQANELQREIERLSVYETTVKRIAWDYIELSHDKAYNQRDEYIRWCRTTIQKDKDRHD